jgi:proline dehydrogenase
MLDSASKTFFHLIAQSQTLKKLASRYGMRKPSSFARRFIAGENIAEAIEAARAVEARGLDVTMDLLGESVTSLGKADAATRDYTDVIDAMIASGVGCNISLKLTQLGLDVDKASAIDNLRKILERAEPAGFFVRVDMENSPYTDVTLEIYETLWRHGYHHLGVVLQSALYRSEKDLASINAFGGAACAWSRVHTRNRKPRRTRRRPTSTRRTHACWRRCSPADTIRPSPRTTLR